MEYLNGGDLYSLLRNIGCLEEDVARLYIAELVSEKIPPAYPLFYLFIYFFWFWSKYVFLQFFPELI